MTPREVIPAEISEEVETEVSTALHKIIEDERRYEARHGESPWRPISTAPKDGSEILIWDNRGRDWGIMDFAYWWEGDWHIPAYDSKATNPTHWMPLPEEPK